MIMVLGTISIFLIVTFNVNTSIANATDYAVDSFSETQARNISNSVAEMLISFLGDSISYRANSKVNLNNILGGASDYRVIDTTINSENVIKIDITSTYMGVTHSAVVIIKENSGTGFIPTTVKAAITTNNPVETKGNIQIDGRQHDINGNLIANSGTYAIWTTQGYSRVGNSKLGSTFSGNDIAPIKSGPDFVNTYQATQVYPGGYPDAPDSVMGGKANGFSAGALKAIAQSGANGSQYVTNGFSLSYPLKGITYIELPTNTRGNRNEWINANIQGSGILIVHNAATNATIKNLNFGTFRGLIIADDIVHIHANIIGAIIGLSPTPSSGNCIGNGNGRVYFSSEAIEKATQDIDPNVTPNFGFAQKRLTVNSWYE